jgi:hypothetical protein
MPSLLVLFWAALIFGSIAWYGFLVFYVGIKAAREIRTMTATLSARPASTPPPSNIPS